ncbi:MAG: Hpt domain-containing protein [Candidatus Neomarinimicrobiota bacterium]
MTNLTFNHELLEVFHEEAQDLIQEMTTDLSILSGEQDKDSEERGREPIYRRLYRNAHTLKGSSEVVGYFRLREISEILQSIFLNASEGKAEFSTSELKLLITGVNKCQKLIGREEVVGYEELLKQLNRILKL